MLFSLISMNKILNQNRFRVYPKEGPVPEGPVPEGPVPEGPGVPLPAGIDILFDWPCLK